MFRVITDRTNKTNELVETLACELRAIDHWDKEYWKKEQRGSYDASAYLSRQKRRTEITRQILAATVG
jgi:hypothetical protein